MKARILMFIMFFAALLTAATVNAQKMAVAVVDQHYAVETAHYKYIMVALVSAYVIYMVLHNKRRKEIDRLLGK